LDQKMVRTNFETISFLLSFFKIIFVFLPFKTLKISVMSNIRMYYY
jgi:hypothetical protein